jgi:hypothetical protein
MLLTVSNVLDVPLRERNFLLLAAGYARIYVPRRNQCCGCLRNKATEIQPALAMIESGRRGPGSRP